MCLFITNDIDTCDILVVSLSELPDHWYCNILIGCACLSPDIDTVIYLIGCAKIVYHMILIL